MTWRQMWPVVRLQAVLQVSVVHSGGAVVLVVVTEHCSCLEHCALWMPKGVSPQASIFWRVLSSGSHRRTLCPVTSAAILTQALPSCFLCGCFNTAA